MEQVLFVLALLAIAALTAGWALLLHAVYIRALPQATVTITSSVPAPVAV